MYNWYAVNTNKLCPTGWHVPTDNEWAIFTNYLIKNGNGYEGVKINIAKSMAATSGWTTSEKVGTVGNDQASNNKSGFNGIPGGSRSFNGTFGGIGGEGAWWSSSGFSNYVAWLRCLDYSKRILYRAYLDKRFGMSVRCVKD